MDKVSSMSLSLEKSAIDILILLRQSGALSASNIIKKSRLTEEEVSEFLTVMKRNQLIKLDLSDRTWSIKPNGINYLRDRGL